MAVSIAPRIAVATYSGSSKAQARIGLHTYRRCGCLSRGRRLWCFVVWQAIFPAGCPYVLHQRERHKAVDSSLRWNG